MGVINNMASGSNDDKVEIGALSLQEIKLWSTNAGESVFARLKKGVL